MKTGQLFKARYIVEVSYRNAAGEIVTTQSNPMRHKRAIRAAQRYRAGDAESVKVLSHIEPSRAVTGGF